MCCSMSLPHGRLVGFEWVQIRGCTWADDITNVPGLRCVHSMSHQELHALIENLELQLARLGSTQVCIARLDA